MAKKLVKELYSVIKDTGDHDNEAIKNEVQKILKKNDISPEKAFINIVANAPTVVKGVTLGKGEYPTLRKLFYSKYFQKAKEPYYSISSFL